MATVAGKLPEHPPAAPARSIPWITIAWFTVLLIAANFPIVKRLVEQWWNDEDMGHGFWSHWWPATSSGSGVNSFSAWNINPPGGAWPSWHGPRCRDIWEC